jgi:hypothetical protein
MRRKKRETQLWVRGEEEEDHHHHHPSERERERERKREKDLLLLEDVDDLLLRLSLYTTRKLPKSA